jgi:hypothetical protein
MSNDPDHGFLEGIQRFCRFLETGCSGIVNELYAFNDPGRFEREWDFIQPSSDPVKNKRLGFHIPVLM